MHNGVGVHSEKLCNFSAGSMQQKLCVACNSCILMVSYTGEFFFSLPES